MSEVDRQPNGCRRSRAALAGRWQHWEGRGRRSSGPKPRVFQDFLADLSRQIGLIERQGNVVREAHSLNSNDRCPGGQRELPGNGFARRHDLLADDPRRRIPAEQLHIFHEAAQAAELLSHLRLQNERALASPDFNQASPNQILDGLSDGGPADPVLRNQFLFVGEAGSGRKSAAGDVRGEHRFHLGVKRERAFVVRLHYTHSYIMMSLCQASDRPLKNDGLSYKAQCYIR